MEDAGTELPNFNSSGHLVSKKGLAIYKRFAQKPLEHLPSYFYVIYLYDIIVHFKTIVDHLEHLVKILDVQHQAGRKLKSWMVKCQGIVSTCQTHL